MKDEFQQEDISFVLSLGHEMNSIESEWWDVELYSGVLEMMSNSNQTKELETVSLFGQNLTQRIEDFDKKFRCIAKSVKEDMESFRDQYDGVIKEFHDLETSYDSDSTNREDICNRMEKCFRRLIQYSENYNPVYTSEIVDNKEKFTTAKEENLAKTKFLLHSKYLKKRADFESETEKNLGYIELLLEDRLNRGLCPISWKEFSRLDEIMRNFCEEVQDQGLKLAPPLDRVFECGVKTQLYKLLVSSSIGSLKTIGEGVSLSEMLEGKLSKRIGEALNFWDENQQQLLSNFGASLTDLLEQTKAEEDIRTLLLRKINLILAMHSQAHPLEKA